MSTQEGCLPQQWARGGLQKEVASKGTAEEEQKVGRSRRKSVRWKQWQCQKPEERADYLGDNILERLGQRVWSYGVDSRRQLLVRGEAETQAPGVDRFYQESDRVFWKCLEDSTDKIQ